MSLKDSPHLVIQIKNLNNSKNYLLQLYQSEALIIDSQNSQSVGLKFKVNINTQLGWYFVEECGRKALRAFSFCNNGEQVWFSASEQELWSLKRLLGCRVVSLNMGEFFETIQKIGSGGQSDVYLVRERISNQFFAMKCLEKLKIESKPEDKTEEILSEIRTMNSLYHENIIKLHSIYECSDKIYLVMEYLQGGNLLQYIKAQGEQIDLRMVKNIMRQLLKAIEHMHSQGLMHRDIKPENIVLENPNGVGILKLIDFGISTKCDLKKFAHPRCGTPGYIAPEIIELNNKKTKTYSNKCDIFSAGVILFKMLTNKDLYDAETFEQLYINNRLGKQNLLPLIMAKNIPAAAQNLVFLMIEQNPQKRVSATEALSHTFFDNEDTIMHNMSMTVLSYIPILPIFQSPDGQFYLPVQGGCYVQQSCLQFQQLAQLQSQISS